jgi:hypothetical protein
MKRTAQRQGGGAAAWRYLVRSRRCLPEYCRAARAPC